MRQILFQLQNTFEYPRTTHFILQQLIRTPGVLLSVTVLLERPVSSSATQQTSSPANMCRLFSTIMQSQSCKFSHCHIRAGRLGVIESCNRPVLVFCSSTEQRASCSCLRMPTNKPQGSVMSHTPLVSSILPDRKIMTDCVPSRTLRPTSS